MSQGFRGSPNKCFHSGPWGEGLLLSQPHKPPPRYAGVKHGQMSPGRGRKEGVRCRRPLQCPFSPHRPGTDWKLPVPLGPVYPPLVSSLSSVKALGRSWELTPPTANRFRIHNVSLPRVRFFLHPLQAEQRERAPSRGELSRVLRPMQTRGAEAGGVYPSPMSLSSPGTW